MFSPMIQNLISGGGQQAAEQRLSQIQNYVKSQDPRVQGVAPQKTSDVRPFQEVLQSSAKSNFGSLLRNPASMSVQAQQSVQPVLRDYTNPSRTQLTDMISRISKKHGVDEKLVNAVIRQESGFNPKAKSHCGAMGLMQLMPATAKGLGVTDAYNPVQNVEGGVKYLKNLLGKYNGNVILALAAYNAGSGAVDKYDGVPPYAETQNYVKKILANYLG
jgi:soluble lytic murein transglycosylase-like protein